MEYKPYRFVTLVERTHAKNTFEESTLERCNIVVDVTFSISDKHPHFDSLFNAYTLQVLVYQ